MKQCVIYVFVKNDTYMHTYIHTYIRALMHAYIHQYIHTYIYIYINHECIHIYIRERDVAQW